MRAVPKPIVYKQSTIAAFIEDLQNLSLHARNARPAKGSDLKSKTRQPYEFL